MVLALILALLICAPCLSHRLLWAISPLWLVAILMLAPGAVLQAFADDADTCANGTGDAKIAACTNIITAARWRGSGLAWAYNARGAAYFAKDDFDGAIADYSEAIRLDPKITQAHKDRGLAYSAKGDLDRALTDYSKAILINPKSEDAYLDRGVANLYAGALTRAFADFDQARALDPKDAYAVLWLDIVGQRIGHPRPLSQAIATIDMNKWPAPVIRMFLSQMQPAAVLAAAAAEPDATKKKGQICAANFYSGVWALRQNEKDNASRLFRLATAHCPKNLIEWSAANAELKALGTPPETSRHN